MGFFDGVHRGHQHVLQSLHTAARERGLSTLAVTFAQHPRSLVRNVAAPPSLTTLQEKIELIGDCHIDAVAVLNFTPEMAQLTAQEFMQIVLHEGLGAEFLLMGYDHRFGRPKADEGFADYVRYGADLGIEVTLATKKKRNFSCLPRPFAYFSSRAMCQKPISYSDAPTKCQALWFMVSKTAESWVTPRLTWKLTQRN